MKHLFIINPTAYSVRGRVSEIVDEIETFFKTYGQVEYDIHITRWSRDASGFIQRYVMECPGLVRIHSFGGMGTLFEIVNSAVGLPNVQIAVYPMGRNNSFLRYFGKEKMHLFRSLRNQVFSGVTPIDALRCGGNFGVSYGVIGLEAESTMAGIEMMERSKVKSDFNYVLPALSSILGKKNMSRHYQITLDGEPLHGDYITMLIANDSCYGKNMNPAVDAHPNDGLLNVYLTRAITKWEFIRTAPLYLRGRYHKTSGRVVHHSGRKLVISSEDVMCLAIDGETFYENSIEYEIMPYALDLVCPHGIDIKKLPRIFGRPEEGLVCETQ